VHQLFLYRCPRRSRAAQVMLLDNVVLVYNKVIADLIIYVAGTPTENELILQAVLQALDETLASLLKSAPHPAARSHRFDGVLPRDDILAVYSACLCVRFL
jgi:hypothetical protein